MFMKLGMNIMSLVSTPHLYAFSECSTYSVMYLYTKIVVREIYPTFHVIGCFDRKLKQLTKYKMEIKNQCPILKQVSSK